MNEIETLHNLNLEWGCLTNLMDKIGSIEDKIEGGWPEVIDMVADAVTEESNNKTDPATLFFVLYQFLWRLYYRLKANPEKRPFNRYSKDRNDDYWVENYSYATLKWAIANGFTQGIDNNVIKIPASKLTDKQRRALDRRCEK